MSGANVAWVSFANDIGPGSTNFTTFQRYFDSVHAAGGNVMRLWLHTNGATTPAFGTDGKVTGPGTNTISDLRQILDLADARDVGLVLCLWSFDMLRESFGTTITDRSLLMLTDSSARAAYIQNALVPMVSALAGHPGIVSWEVFNEAEGMSNEHGWSGIRRVSMRNIQIFVNQVAGAIHRADPTARVTTGAWAFIAMSDVTTLSAAAEPGATPGTMSLAERARIEAEFNERYNLPLSADEILSNFSVAANINYYRDDRLIEAGGDPDGALDFYTVHYYDWAGTALSPFHYPYSHWNLTKPLMVAEFYLNTVFGIAYQDLYRVLFETGYSGALSWQWINNTQQTRTKEIMRDLYADYPGDLIVDQVPGTIFTFKATPSEVQAGQPCTLSWSAAWSSVVTLNGVPVSTTGDTTVVPTATTQYVLEADGTVNTSSTVTVTMIVSDVSESAPGIPADFSLEQNYPNPFNPSTTIGFAIPARSEVAITIHNILGQEVARLYSGWLDAGYYSTVWNADAPTGLYFCRMTAESDERPSARRDLVVRMALVR
ncbi:MAG TPA: T9SS type A sorting domain-containing protein [Bacteroidota bacterium]|nr:T9SS type A sorting domain-containing protein [Bacteroidota bacterium]